MAMELELTSEKMHLTLNADGKSYIGVWSDDRQEWDQEELTESDARLLLVFAQAVVDRNVNGV